jgi:hypothetical protein
MKPPSYFAITGGLPTEITLLGIRAFRFITYAIITNLALTFFT